VNFEIPADVATFLEADILQIGETEAQESPAESEGDAELVEEIKALSEEELSELIDEEIRRLA